VSSHSRLSTDDASSDEPRRELLGFLADRITSGEFAYIRAKVVARETGLTGGQAGEWLSRLAGSYENGPDHGEPTPCFEFSVYRKSSNGTLWHVERPKQYAAEGRIAEGDA